MLREARRNVGPDRDPLIQNLTQLLFVHVFMSSVMPRAMSATCKACAAREQCVFTLPSEQLIARAVAATSSSSQ